MKNTQEYIRMSVVYDLSVGRMHHTPPIFSYHLTLHGSNTL